ncbi:MAG: zf-TFIIB domain-containing protein [Candidatus Sericytochromatia bacterium]|nr:zf-TFIIB domain-containing protein [Candidatus Sericytochromatia bacterium]
MLCPACQLPLDHVEAAPGLFLDVCQAGCQGLWFDNQELQALDEAGEHPEAAVVQRDALAARGTGPLGDAHPRRPCPRCEGVKMRRFWFSWNRDVEIDQCGQCGGTWLDHGELTRVREAFSSAEAREAEADRRAAELIAGHETEQSARLAPIHARHARRGPLGRALDKLVAGLLEER